MKKPRKPDTSRRTGNPRGRGKTDVDDLRMKILYKMPKGLGHNALAKALGISESQYYELKANNPEFRESVKFYMNITPADVLQAFTKRAIGYDFVEETHELQKNEKTGKMEMVLVKTVSKHVAADTQAAFNFLKNKLSRHFKEKVEVKHKLPPSVLEHITFVISGKNG